MTAVTDSSADGTHGSTLCAIEMEEKGLNIVVRLYHSLVVFMLVLIH